MVKVNGLVLLLVGQASLSFYLTCQNKNYVQKLVNFFLMGQENNIEDVVNSPSDQEQDTSEPATFESLVISR